MTGKVKSASEKKKEDWVNAKWRPMMGWVYMATCVTDFILFPVLWSMLQAALNQPVTAWQPITLQGGGLFHLSMGAIIGVSAFGRTREKLAGAHNDNFTSATPTSRAAAYGAFAANGFNPTSSFDPPTPTGVSSSNTSRSADAPYPPTVITGYGGKPAPAPEDDLVL
jgi:hypothetical protein